MDGSLIALSHAYPDVSVVLADIVGKYDCLSTHCLLVLIVGTGFTAMSSTITPQELVTILNTIFSKFDDIMEDLHLEKIRTIG